MPPVVSEVDEAILPANREQSDSTDNTIGIVSATNVPPTDNGNATSFPANQGASPETTETHPPAPHPYDDENEQRLPQSICLRIRDALSLSPKDATPIKWPVVLNVVFALFACVVNITMLFPYLPQMIRDMGYEEQKIG